MKDDIFKTGANKQFEFDERVASVFDDMIGRSVPFYSEAGALICEILSRYLPQNARVIDLGCSTASMLLGLWQKRKDLRLFGVDEAEAMIARARSKASAFGADISLSVGDILSFDLNKFDAIILNYTMQFVRPPLRMGLARRIYEGLNKGGVFVFSEKIIYEDKRFGHEMIEIYEDYKHAQGYSRYEIAQKREALENVLIPYTEDENKALLLEAGFSNIQSVFKWGNFMSFVCFK